jgi:hypothetical protein
MRPRDSRSTGSAKKDLRKQQFRGHISIRIVQTEYDVLGRLARARARRAGETRPEMCRQDQYPTKPATTVKPIEAGKCTMCLPRQ